MTALQEILVMLATAPDDRIAAARAALMGADAIPSPVAGAVSVEALCKSYGVHRATVKRRLDRHECRPVKFIGGRNYYETRAAVAAMEGIG